MESAAISGARWVVGKALSPLSGGLVEAWAATSELGPNIKAIKMELLYAQAMLDNARGREFRSHALAELLHNLRGVAYDAEDVLDELDYFRIQDELDGTYEVAVDTMEGGGCVQSLARNARHTAIDIIGQITSCCPCHHGRDDGDHKKQEEATLRPRLLCGWCLCGTHGGRAHGVESSTPHAAGGEAVGESRQGLAFRARSTVSSVGKILSCYSSHNADGSSKSQPEMLENGKRIHCFGAWPCKTGQRKHSMETTPKLIFNRVDVSRRMKHIVEELKPICDKVSTILSMELLGSAHSTIQDTTMSRITISQSVEPEVYGRDQTRDEIIDEITEGEYHDKNLTVLPIVGPGGIGKTTLAQYIYSSQKLESHFELKIWISVSLNFNVYKITQDILKEIGKFESGRNGSLNHLQKLAEEELKSRKFLIVLDDIWKCQGEEWKKLLVPFTKGEGKGNMILVTTRFPLVANTIKTTRQPLVLEGLDDKYFMSFFKACVFGDDKNSEKYSELLGIGEKIVKKLKYSPLAAKTVGRLLRNHLTLDYWRKVLESKEWELQSGEDDIMPALKLSYDYLPFHLQQCFSYCALFPDDYWFNSEEIVHFWVGLGLLHSDNQNKRIEDIGLDYLSDLVNYGFFKKDGEGGNARYVIHDLLRELALKISSSEFLSIDCSDARSVEVPHSIRHLSIIVNHIDTKDKTTTDGLLRRLGELERRLKACNLHSLMLFGAYTEESLAKTFGNIFRQAKALRILHLSRLSYIMPPLSHQMESFLHNVSNLFHLRYLTLGPKVGNNDLLPRAFSRLYHLIFLDIRKQEYGIKLPRDISNLVKLRHFLVRDVELHSNISNVGKLKFLQELRRFDVKKESNGFELKELGELSELRGTLQINHLENAQVNEAGQAKLIDKNNLKELELHWDPSRPNVEREVEAQVLEGLEPHNNLKGLLIGGHGGFAGPTWLCNNVSVINLESLALTGLSWEVFPPFGQLRSGKVTMDALNMSRSIHNLKILKLHNLSKVKYWAGEKQSLGGTCHLFPNLEELTIYNCAELMELPFSHYAYHQPEQDSNMHWCPKIQILDIQQCPKLLVLPPIPWTHTLKRVNISSIGSGLEGLYLIDNTLIICGNKDLHSLDEKVLAFHNLTELQFLNLNACPPLMERHLQMLTSLRTLILDSSSEILVPSQDEKCSRYQLPVDFLGITSCPVSGKGVTHLLSHLPKISELQIIDCPGIQMLGVEAEQEQQHQPRPSSSSTEEIEHEGLLLLPAALSCCLNNLLISKCPELRLAVVPTKDGKEGGGGLQDLHSLEKLDIEWCPNFMISSCFHFPTSLQELYLTGVKGMKTLEPLANLTSLTQLHIQECGEELTSEGMWPLAQGHLTKLVVFDSPKFFVGFDTIHWGLQDEQDHQLLLQRSSKLQKLETDDVAGVLMGPVCSFLSSSLTMLDFNSNDELEKFTEEQEEALQLLTSLQDLRFVWCHRLHCLPSGLHKLPSLMRLEIEKCPAIRSLSKEDLPNSLQELDIGKCGNEELKQQCRELMGTMHFTIKLD